MNETYCETCDDRTDFKQQGEFLAKWIWALPWLFMLQMAGVIMQGELELAMAGNILNLASTAVYGGILLKISSEEREYSMAGMLTLATAALGLIATIANQTYISQMVLVVSAVLTMMECEYEFSAHAAVLEGVGNKLGRKWRKLWKRMSHGLLTIVVGMLLILIVIGGLVIMVGVVMILSTIILKLVYLFRTAQAFQDVAAS